MNFFTAESIPGQEARENPFFNARFLDNLDFSAIEMSDYLPAVEQGIKESDAEMQAIINNPALPTFDNTIRPLQYRGESLSRVTGVFFNLMGSMSTPERQALCQEIQSRLTDFYLKYAFDKRLFARIETVYKNRNSGDLNPIQIRLVEKMYEDFAQSGINLPEEKQKRLAEIDKRLTELTFQFDCNLDEQARTSFVFLPQSEENRLNGLSSASKTAYAQQARAAGKDGFLFRLAKPVVMDVLTFASDRKLRQSVLEMYISQGQPKNLDVFRQVINLRIEQARLLGYKNYAELQLENNTMAKSPENALKTLRQAWANCLGFARRDLDELTSMAQKETGVPSFQLAAWDWLYYANKLKKQKFDLNEADLTPYFELHSVKNAALNLFSRLYGISFIQTDKIKAYHPDVEVYEVLDADGSHLGYILLDFYVRDGKNPGAWISAIRFYKKQVNPQTGDVTVQRPILSCVYNFPAPSDGVCLLTPENAAALFHELGHSMNCLFTEVEYPGLAGLPPDFGELPSQLMENWVLHKDFLPLYAKHYKTGQPIPSEIVDKVNAAAKFNRGYIRTEIMSAAFLDLYWHRLENEIPESADINELEKNYLSNLGLPSAIAVRYRSAFFRHLMGGYAAQYYGYVWCDFLDADAFSVFEKNGIFDRETANRFRNEILRWGSARDMEESYRQFRGGAPSVDAYMKEF